MDAAAQEAVSLTEIPKVFFKPIHGIHESRGGGQPGPRADNDGTNPAGLSCNCLVFSYILLLPAAWIMSCASASQHPKPKSANMKVLPFPMLTSCLEYNKIV